MSITGMLRSSLPSTSKSVNSPRISSPLATHSSSVTSGEDDSEDNDDYDDDDDSSSDDDDDDAGDGTNLRDSDDSDVELEQWLARAKENARRRAAADSASAGPSSIAGPSVNLDDFDLAAMHEDEEENRLPAIYTRHADPAQVFETTSASKTSNNTIKGKGRAIPNADNLDDEENGEILPGVKSKWGELPFVRKSKKVLKEEKAKTAGKDWFDLPRRPAASLSNEEKRELQAMRLSNVMDPKKFMRGETKRDNKKLPEFFQTGYIIKSGQGPRAGLAAPSNKIKKQSFLGNVLVDDRGKEWSKKKYLQLQEKASSGGKNFYKKKMRDRKSVDGGKRKGKGGRRS